MSKLIRPYSIYALLSRYHRCAATAVVHEITNEKLNLIFQSFRDYRRKNKNSFGICSIPIAVPLGITTALCQQVSKHNEKRFFRAVQYGVDEEVKR